MVQPMPVIVILLPCIHPFDTIIIYGGAPESKNVPVQFSSIKFEF